MSEPVTTIDQRFSDPSAVATEWDETRHTLATAELFWLTTVKANGHPHITPLVAVWLDEAIHFCSGATEQKTLNLRANPHVILSTGCNHWDEGLDIMIEGEATLVTDDENLARLAEAWASKWDGRWHYQVRNGSFYHPDSTGTIPVFAVKPAKIFAFAKGTFSQTRHQF